MIAIIAALDIEVDALEKEIIDLHHVDDRNYRILTGIFEGVEILVIKCGVGKAAAAMCTTAIIERFKNVDKIINIGIAGSLSSDLHIYDKVISTKIIQADFDTSPIDGISGIGACFESLINIARLDNIGAKFGVIASGDQFIATDQQKKHIIELFPEAIAVEMESGAIAQVANFYHLPFLIIRSISDEVGKEGQTLDYNRFANKACAEVVVVLKKVIRNI